MRLLLVLLLVGVPTGAANGERLEELPADLHAVRVRSGVALITVGESRQVRRVRIHEGWYFTTVGYERLLVKTAEWQQSLSTVTAKAEACASMADTYARQVAQVCGAPQPEPQPPEHAVADFVLVAVSAFVLGVGVGRRARRHT